MDDALATKIDSFVSETGEKSEITFRSLDDQTIEIIAGEQKETWRLKPLSELFGQDTGRTADPQDDAFMPLFLRIEEEIASHDRVQRLNDATVGLSLDQLGMDPDGPSADPLARDIQSALQLLLSLNDYSRQEVRQAMRKISKSVQRHHDGDRGYLKFIAEFFGGGRKPR